MSPAKKEWKLVHADVIGRLGLPCKLRFSTDVKIGQHSFEEGGSCAITVNPDFDFRQPEHLILHEAAHHKAMAHLLDINFDRKVRLMWHGKDYTCCTGLIGGHCEHWARILTDMYAETGYALPEGTQFKTFAEVANIIHRKYKETADDAEKADTATVA